MTADREALVRIMAKAHKAWAVDLNDGRAIREAYADALLAAGLRLPGGEETMAWAVVGEDGALVDGTVTVDRWRTSAYLQRGGCIRPVAIRVVEEGEDEA